MLRLFLITCLLVGGLAAGTPAASAAAAGDLDGSFGTGGVVDETGPSTSTAVAVQEDGRIVVVGEFDTGSYDVAVRRLLPDGTRDPSFGGGDGQVEFDNGGEETVHDVALAADGRIVVAGETTLGPSYATLYRFLPDGSADPSFDGDGAVGFDHGAYEAALGVVVQPDGRIVAAGVADGKLAVWRRNPDGSADTALGGTGHRLIDLGPGSRAMDVALGSGGTIVLAGIGGSENAVLVRLTPAGAGDASFGPAGVRVLGTASNGGYASAVQVLPDGRVLAGVTTFSALRASSPEAVAIVRRLEGGEPDPSFGGSGVVPLPAAEAGAAMALAVVGDGGILVSGREAPAGGGSRGFVHRLRSDGSADPAFGGGDGHVEGALTTSRSAGFLDAAVQPDGRLVVVGNHPNAGRTSRYVTRTDPPPTPAASMPTPSAPPAVAPTPTPPTTPRPPRRPTASQVIKLPTGCVKAGRLRLRLARPAGVTLRSATVTVNGRRRGSLTRRLTRPFTLTGLPKRAAVRVSVVLADGARLSRSRRYTACPRRRAS